jgi:N-hydroxyarylamine O-acetyltransferase
MKKFKAYFKRLNINPERCSLSMLRELQQKHIAEFSFNNLSVLLGQPISLEISDIVDKIVIRNFGGYCFEHNKLMYEVLKALGFKVRCLIARVLNNRDIDTPRTHRITLLDWEGEQYLIDVGFGYQCLHAPLKILAGEKSVQNGTTFKLKANNHQSYHLGIVTPKGFYSLYAFDLNIYTEADCIMGNFYSSHHPDAVFVNNLVMSRILPDKILSLRNREYRRISQDNVEIINIDSASKLNGIVKNDFAISLNSSDSELLYQIIEKQRRLNAKIPGTIIQTTSGS